MKSFIKIVSVLIFLAPTLSNAKDANLALALRMYGSQRAWKEGDLLTVNIIETTKASKAEALNTSKTASAQSGTSTYDRGSGGTFVQDKMGRLMKNVANGLPTYDLGSTSSFQGSGSSSSSESLTMNFTVRVIDVLDNGILVIRGERQIIKNEEKISMVLSGLVRHRDISSTNIISSERIADAHIYYETGGDVSNGTRPGFFWRLFQFCNPF